MFIDFLLDDFKRYRESDAIVWRNHRYSYALLREQVLKWKESLSSYMIRPGTIVALQGDFSPTGIALFLALVDVGAILVPLTISVVNKRNEFIAIAGVECLIEIDGATDTIQVTSLKPATPRHPLYSHLASAEHPGLVLFSSGSTGTSKAALHDMVPFLEKFTVRRRAARTISFLLYDHIGGINTMLHTLSNGGCLITVNDRSPDGVLDTIARFQVELLPTSPTFLNLVLLSEAYKRHDLTSLRTITYGTEPMPESTLKRLHALLPDVQLMQTYGLSEIGILRAKSKSSDSLWVKVGGEGFQTRVADNILHIKARSAMLGYLNAPSPFTEDGWLITGDRVEVDGEYVRILGRDSDLINVGGHKVYPAEVESVILEMDSVSGVEVFGTRNPITGNMVCARVVLKAPEDPREFAHKLKAFCSTRLENFKVPVRVIVEEQEVHSPRFKKMRTKDTGRR
jgi:acyl-coenzyme A synthetase/AMP-(fatty) acid ligase